MRRAAFWAKRPDRARRVAGPDQAPVPGGQAAAADQGLADRLEDRPMAAGAGVPVPLGDPELLDAQVVEGVGEVDAVQPVTTGNLADDAPEPLRLVLAVGAGQERARWEGTPIRRDSAAQPE